jgi:hypothetical protein
MTRITITRRQLYDQVWSTPMMQLSKTYGLSDVGLAKLCKRHNIPRPPRGYWAKLEFGHRTKKIALPDPHDDYELMHYEPKDSSVCDSDLDMAVKEAAAAEKLSEARIEVADTLRGAHELVSQANQEFAAAKKDEDGFLELPAKATLKIHVSKGQLRRTLRIMDALLKALNERGYASSLGLVQSNSHSPESIQEVQRQVPEFSGTDYKRPPDANMWRCIVPCPK